MAFHRISALALLVASSTPVLATSFYQRPFPDTVQAAPALVRGKMGGSSTDWATGEDGSRRIYTYFDMQVSEVIKGDVSGSRILVRQMGGEKDGVGLMIPGVADFSTGEDVVLMLGHRNSDSSYDVWEMMMGKYKLQPGPNGEECLVGPGANSLEKGESQVVHDEAQPQVAGASCKWSLESLRKLVREQSGDVSSPAPSALPSSLARPSASPSVQALTQNQPPTQISGGSDTLDRAEVWKWLRIIGALAAIAVVGFVLRKRRRV